jgi:hypothetical protein
VFRDESLELGDQRVVTAKRQIGLDAVFERGEPELLEPPHLALSERLVGEVCERRPAPERERGA